VLTGQQAALCLVVLRMLSDAQASIDRFSTNIIVYKNTAEYAPRVQRHLRCVTTFVQLRMARCVYNGSDLFILRTLAHVARLPQLILNSKRV